jgi:hypothetical protein
MHTNKLNKGKTDEKYRNFIENKYVNRNFLKRSEEKFRATSACEET